MATDGAKPRLGAGYEVVVTPLIAWKDQTLQLDVEPPGRGMGGIEVSAKRLECLTRLEAIVVRERMGADFLTGALNDSANQRSCVVKRIAPLVGTDTPNVIVGRQAPSAVSWHERRQMGQQLVLLIEKQQSDGRPGRMDTVTSEDIEEARNSIARTEKPSSTWLEVGLVADSPKEFEVQRNREDARWALRVRQNRSALVQPRRRLEILELTIPWVCENQV